MNNSYAKISVDDTFYKGHLTRVTFDLPDDIKENYMLFPHELSGSHLEYLMKNQLINITDKNQLKYIFNPDMKSYNAVVMTGKLIKLLRKDVQVTQVEFKPSNTTTTKSNSQLSRSMTVKTDEGEFKHVTDASYILPLLKIINLINKQNGHQLDKLERRFDLLRREKMDLPDDFSISEIGDIHFRTGKQLQIKEPTIIKTFRVDSKDYCLLGYPDVYRMISHLAHNDSNVPVIHSESYQEVIRRYHTNNYQLIARLSNLLNKDEPDNQLTETEIKDQANLWKILGTNSNEIQYIKRHFPNEYAHYEAKYKELVSQYIKDNKLLKQSLNRVKYTFHLFQLNEKKEFDIFIDHLNKLRPEHKSVLEYVDRTISEEVYKHFLHQSKDMELGKMIMRTYVRHSGFFHFETEYVNPITNHFHFSHIHLTLMDIKELIYNIGLKNEKGETFLSRLPIKFPVTKNKLSELEEQSAGGKPILIYVDKNAKKIMNENIKDCRVVLFNIDNLKQISCVVELKGRYYLLEMMGNKFVINNYQAFICRLTNAKKQIMFSNKAGKSELMYYEGYNPYQITTLRPIDDRIKNKVFNLFFKDKIPLTHMYFEKRIFETLRQPTFDMQPLKAMLNVSKYVPFFVKYLVLYHHLTKLGADKRQLKEEIIKHQIGQTQIAKYKRNTINDATLREFTSGKYVGIVYRREGEVDYKAGINFKYLLWIISKAKYDKLVSDITTILTQNNSIPLQLQKLKAYLTELEPIDDDFVRYVYDINQHNKENILGIMQSGIGHVNGIEKPRNGLESFVHAFGFIGNDCLHMKMNANLMYTNVVNKDRYMNYYSRSINYETMMNMLKTDPNYYHNGIINSYINIGWRFIFLDDIYRKGMIKSRQSGGAKMVTTKKLKSVPEYKKKLYKEMGQNELTNNDYNKMVRLIDFDMLVKNISSYLDKKPNEELYNILHNFDRLTNVDNLHTGAIQLSTQINNIYNKNKMALIFASINIPRVINNIRHSNKFDVFINKGNLPVNQLDQFEKELHKMDVINNVYGSFKKTDIDTYPSLSMEHQNSYNNVVLINQSTIYVKYPTFFVISEMPRMMMKLILGMSLLKDKGNMFIYVKASYKYPMLEQYLDMIVHMFKTVEYEKLNFNRYNAVIHCHNFDRKKYEEHKSDLSKLLTELGDYIVDKSDYESMLGDYLFYDVGKEGKDMEVAYKIKTKIPSSKQAEKLADIMELQYYDYLNYVDYMMIRHMPLTSDRTRELFNKLVYDYLINIVKFFEQNKVPYNKYYLSLLDDYYKNIMRNMLVMSSNINVNLINYPSRSISLKRSRSVTKRDRKSKTKSIATPKNFLDKITGKNKPYVYDEFDDTMTKLKHIKNKRTMVLGTVSPDKQKIVTRISEDFTRGISIYLQKRFKIRPVPSNAFTKLWEIYHQFNLVPNKKTIKMFHLAEAPGQFIKATEYYISKKCPRNEKYLWKANSLNPFNKKVTDRFGTALFRDDYGLIKKYRQHWIWGEDDTGDITVSKNVRWYRNYIHKWAENEKVDVVTGDGGLEITASTKDLQRLDYAQFLLAAATNSVGGSCVIKTFTPFLGSKPETRMASGFFVGLTFLYSLLYRNVHLVKPYTSRPTSGEYYVVGKGFIGLPDNALDKLLVILDNFKENQTFFDKKNIPEKFIGQTNKFIEQMADLNINSIERQIFFMACSSDKDKVISNKTNCDYYLNPRNLEEIHLERYKKWVNTFGFR